MPYPLHVLTETWSLVYYLVVQGFGVVLAVLAALFFMYLVLKEHHTWRSVLILSSFFVGAMLFFWFPVGVSPGLEYPFGLKTYGPANGPTLPLSNILAFFRHHHEYERVPDIARSPIDIPTEPLGPNERGEIELHITTKEVISEIAPGVVLNYWTFDGRVPGPFLRVREGDMVSLTITNDPTSMHMHSIDLHAVTGPGGGAVATDVKPGESKTLRFKALHPGLFVYHCAHPNVANHMAHGMYGLILVEPAAGLPEVHRELYIMQGEFYTAAPRGTKGLQAIDAGNMLDGNPTYVVFNGRTGAISKDEIVVQQGEKVRLYVGNGGVNLISSFHLIGEVFDTVYPEAQIGGSNFHNVQTTVVPAGGATIAEFTADVPGSYVLVDHALARMDKGAWGTIRIVGENRPDIFFGDTSGASAGH